MTDLRLNKRPIDFFFNEEQADVRPRVFWYASAGKDFRGPVFLSEKHRKMLRLHLGRNLAKPDFYLYTCLGPEAEEIEQLLSRGESAELYNDGITKITGSKYQKVSLPDDLELTINPAHIHYEGAAIDHENMAFGFELKMEGEGYPENDTAQVLYIKHENIDVFEKIIIPLKIKVEYLCATREGMGMGGCGKSVIQHIYEDGAPSFHAQRGFKPEYVILYGDFTKDLFKEQLSAQPLIQMQEHYVNYIQEKGSGLSQTAPHDEVVRLVYASTKEIIRDQFLAICAREFDLPTDLLDLDQKIDSTLMVSLYLRTRGEESRSEELALLDPKLLRGGLKDMEWSGNAVTIALDSFFSRPGTKKRVWVAGGKEGRINGIGLRRLSLVFALEEELGFDLGMEEIAKTDDCESFGDLLDFMLGREK